MVKTEEELFAALEALDQMERDLRTYRLQLEADCAAYGHLVVGYTGRFRIDHLRVRHNIKTLRAQRTKEQAA